MSNAHYRTLNEQPQARPEYHPRRAEFSKILGSACTQFYLKHGGAEIDHAIELLDTFAMDGKAYVKQLLADETEAAQAQRNERLKNTAKPDETKVPEGKARELVKKARRAKPVIDASSATRLCKLLIELVQLRVTVLTNTTSTVEEVFLAVTDGKGFDTGVAVQEIARHLRAALQLE